MKQRLPLLFELWCVFLGTLGATVITALAWLFGLADMTGQIEYTREAQVLRPEPRRVIYGPPVIQVDYEGRACWIQRTPGRENLARGDRIPVIVVTGRWTGETYVE